MKATLPEPVWKHFTRRRQSVLVRGTPAKSYQRQQGILATLNRAIQQHRVVQIEYQSLDRPRPQAREIEPYALVLHQGSLYLVASDADAPPDAPLKHLKLDRFHAAVPLDRRFRPRPGFNAEQHFADSLGVYKSARPQEFVIRFTPRAAVWIREDPWHPQQRIEEGTAGDVIVTIPAAHELEVISRVLAWGADAELLSPPASRRALASLLGQLARRYEKEG
jgi:predicted DNA-binding transcriptional regulator YafY